MWIPQPHPKKIPIQEFLVLTEILHFSQAPKIIMLAYNQPWNILFGYLLLY